MLSVGTEAPELELPDQGGKPVALSDFAGERVVVYRRGRPSASGRDPEAVHFYPEADTPGCTREAEGFRDNYDEFAARGISVLGISDDPVEDVAAFADNRDLSFQHLSDEDGEVTRAYESYGERTGGEQTVEIVSRNTYVVGPDGRIERTYEGVSPDGHAEDLLAAVGGTS